MSKFDQIENALAIIQKKPIDIRRAVEIVRAPDRSINLSEPRTPDIRYGRIEPVRSQYVEVVSTRSAPPIITDQIELGRVCTSRKMPEAARYKIRNGVLVYVGNFHIGQMHCEGDVHDGFEISSSSLSLERCTWCNAFGSPIKCSCGAYLCSGLVYRIGNQEYTECPCCNCERALVVSHWTQRGTFPKVGRL